MTDVNALQSIAERLAKIANDCFDLRAAERLRNLVDELQAASGKRRGHVHDRTAGDIDAGRA
jgi:hypothetical protein